MSMYNTLYTLLHPPLSYSASSFVVGRTSNFVLRYPPLFLPRSPNPQSIAQSCLDAMALNLPTKHTFGPLMELCNSFLSNPEPHVRKAAVAALGVMSEGCAEPVKARLTEILPKILEVRLYSLRYFFFVVMIFPCSDKKENGFKMPRMLVVLLFVLPSVVGVTKERDLGLFDVTETPKSCIDNRSTGKRQNARANIARQQTPHTTLLFFAPPPWALPPSLREMILSHSV